MGLEGSARPPARRRLRLAAVVFSAVLVAGAVPGLASGQEEEFVNGSGYASAQILRVGPTAARLSLAPILGLSLADYLSTLGRGQASAADWAAIGIAEPALPENTPLVKVESTGPDGRIENAVANCSQTNEPDEYSSRCFVAGGEAGGGGGGLMELFARARTTPFGESRFRLAAFEVPGLINMGKGHATATSGIVDGNIRESTAVVEISGLDFAGGAVKLSGLHWEAVQRTGVGGEVETVTGKFTVQGASAGGVPLPILGGDLESVIGPLNAALAPTGFAMTLPEVQKLGDVARVTPLAIEIIDSPLGRQFLAPIISELQPIRDPLIQELITGEDAPFKDASAAVLIADLTLGIATGASQLHIELGGANAFTEGERFENPFFSLPELPPVVGSLGSIFTPGTAGTQGTPGTPGVQDTGELVAALPQSPAQRTVPGDKGGVAVMVGLIGLIAAAGLAAADWYRMRTARRLAAGG